MRIFLITFLLCGAHQFTQGQEILGSDGNFNNTAQGSLSWTLGEVITETITNGNTILTQGFHQNYEDFLGSPAIPQYQEIEVYPNPFSNEIFLSMNEANRWFHVKINDVGGRNLFSSQLYFGEGVHARKIELSEFLPGTYFLHITSQNSENPIIFPIIKPF